MSKLSLQQNNNECVPTLLEILKFLPDLNWSILSVGGILDGNAFPTSWLSIANLEQGLLCNTSDLRSFAESANADYTELQDCVIIGVIESSKLRRYNSLSEMEDNCEIVLNLTEGDYWTISSKDETLLQCIAAAFKQYNPMFVDSSGIAE